MTPPLGRGQRHASKEEFNRAFCLRVKALRGAAGMTQAAMADALGIGRTAYQKYETRSPLPHALVAPFAALSGADFAMLYGT